MKSTAIGMVAALFFAALSAAAPEISITGVVTDGTAPVDKAVVALVNNSRFSDTTDASGAFFLSNATGTLAAAGWNSETSDAIRLQGSRLFLSAPGGPGGGEVMLYTTGGRRLFGRLPGKSGSQSSVTDLPRLTAGVYFVTLRTNRVSIVRKLVAANAKVYLPENGPAALSLAGSGGLGPTGAAVDQLKISKAGFVDKLVPVSSYKAKNLSIVLQRVDSTAPSETSLHKKYKNFFPIGAAVDPNSYKDAHAALWKEHFNAAVCENEMKWAALQPSEGNFQFAQANAMVNAARGNGMLVRGHVLVWFDQTPDWVFQGPSGGQATKQVLLERIRTHVARVMKEFKGRVYAWDVVNEAVIGYTGGGQDVGEDLASLARWGYRNSKWYQIAGEDFIFEAFKAARAADPEAKLFYNDFWNYLDGKREFIISFVKKLKEQNLIDGVGLQCHFNISPAQEKKTNQSVYQTVENVEKEIKEYAALGLDVHVTELDISIYTRDYTSDDQSKWYTGADLNEEYQNRLAARYKEFFDMFRRNADKIKNVTFWGIADDNTWLSEFPSKRPDHPLLFDRRLKPKKAFDAVMNF
jgi:endo-1,4-beta-xylanase